MKGISKGLIKVCILGGLIVLGIIIVGGVHIQQEEPKKEMITVSSIQEVLDTDLLSTFQVLYGGICKVPSEKDPNEVDYYVAYNATVKAGISFSDIQIELDEVEKIVRLTLPKTQPTSVVVDMESLDYIFQNKKRQTETVLSEAYTLCVADAEQKSASDDMIYEMALQSAYNTIEGLVGPFVEAYDASYTIEIQ